ncbi:MAG TPA: metallophosphoesterase, partial [Vicinamibacteria bacterium]|nr:metallophosphoesterase [Vicinamibacteria bacterium]
VALGLLALAAAAVAAGLPAAAAIAWSRFTAFQLVAQVAFGELLVASAVVGWACRRRRRPARAALGLGAALLLAAAYVQGYHREPHDLQVRSHDVELRGLPHDALPLRIAHLSDIQTARVGAYEERALLEARALAPDLVVFTGDYVQGWDDETPRGEMSAFRDLVARVGLRPPLGAFAVKGDVDPPDWRRLFEGTPVTCLEDEAARVALPGGRTLAVVGLAAGTSHAHTGTPVRQVIARAPRADLQLVVGHAPDFIAAVEPASFDLALAGHTHGGQVVVPFYGPLLLLSRLPRRYAGDVHDYAAIPIHVSRGIGMERRTAPQVRFLCPPELCLLTLRPAAAAASRRAGASAPAE